MAGKNNNTAYNSNETSWADQWDPEPASYEYTSFDKKTGNNNNGSSKISSKVGDTFGKTKSVASTGVKKEVRFRWGNLGSTIQSLFIKQVLLDELKGRNRGCHKCNENSNYMCWHYFLKGFKILESTKRQGAHQISLEFQWSVWIKGACIYYLPKCT